MAAMAPSTNIGAASLVTSTGEDLPETLEAKATEAAAAFIRSIAEERGRNADALEGTVVEAKAYAASEARRWSPRTRRSFAGSPVRMS